MINLLKIGKVLTGFIVSAGVSSVVTNVVKSTTPKDIKIINSILVGIGGFVLSSMIADKASKYVIEEIDSLISSTKKEDVFIKDSKEPTTNKVKV